MPLRLLSLFSGCGGMDLGFEGDFWVHKDCISKTQKNEITYGKPQKDFLKLNPTRFETIFANDIVPEAKKVWSTYFSKRKSNPDIYLLKSIVDLVNQHKDGKNIFPENIDIVTGGFPCQDFSLAGKRKGLSSHKNHTGKLMETAEPSIETRGALYIWMKEVIEITKPKVFIAENVKGLVNLSNVKEIIQNDFSKTHNNGYFVFDPMILQAADFGVPQSRERVFFVGILKSALRPDVYQAFQKSIPDDKFLPFPVPTHSYSQNSNSLSSPVQIKNIFNNLPEPEYSDDPSHHFYSRAKFMGKHCQGQTEINPSGVAPTIRSEHHGNIEFRRLSIKNGGKNLEEILDKEWKERRLSPRECALLQTFPPDFDFVIPDGHKRFAVSPSSAYKMIGNAVPPLLAYHIAKRLESLWDELFI